MMRNNPVPERPGSIVIVMIPYLYSCVWLQPGQGIPERDGKLLILFYDIPILILSKLHCI